MIYAHICLFWGEAAFITANDEVGLRDMFRAVVMDCLKQFEGQYGKLPETYWANVREDMDALQPMPLESWQDYTYELNRFSNGASGAVCVLELFETKEAVLEKFQPWVDGLNVEGKFDEDEKWAVFDGGFFPSEQGYEIDELFK